MVVRSGARREGDRAGSGLAGGPVVAARPVGRPSVRPKAGFATYLSFVKAHIDVTFVLVAVTGSVLARTASPWDFLAVAGAVALLSAGAECWANVIDRDIDAAMPRTAGRALPRGRISVRAATSLGAVLTAAGLAIAATLGLFPFLFLMFASLSYVVVYGALTKRSTPWSVVLTAPIGSLTLWAGYAAVGEPISRAAWLLGAAVAAWVPAHIWAIATRYSGDYARASVPMAPVVWSRRKLGLASLALSLAMGAFATGGLVAIGSPATPWVVAPVALLSVLVAAGAVLLPWHQWLAGRQIRLVTAYLLLVLLAAIVLAA